MSGQGTLDGVPTQCKITLTICADGTALVESWSQCWTRGKRRSHACGVYRVRISRLALAGLSTPFLLREIADAPRIALEPEQPPQQGLWD